MGRSYRVGRVTEPARQLLARQLPSLMQKVAIQVQRRKAREIGDGARHSQEKIVGEIQDCQLGETGNLLINSNDGIIRQDELLQRAQLANCLRYAAQAVAAEVELD